MICVYKILSPDLKECYVGSSIDYTHRINRHKNSNNNCNSKKLFDKYGFDNCTFVILEQCIEEELLVKEQWWQDHSVGLVNRNCAIGDREKRRSKNLDKIKEQEKKRYEANKEKKKEYQKKYREDNKEKIKEQTKKYRESKKLKSI